MTGWAHSGWETRLNPEGEDDFWGREVEAGARQRLESSEHAKITGLLRGAVGEGLGRRQGQPEHWALFPCHNPGGWDSKGSGGGALQVLHGRVIPGARRGPQQNCSCPHAGSGDKRGESEVTCQ